MHGRAAAIRFTPNRLHSDGRIPNETEQPSLSLLDALVLCFAYFCRFFTFSHDSYVVLKFTVRSCSYEIPVHEKSSS